MSLDISSPPQSWASTAWTVGTGGTSYFSQNGATDENWREYDLDPWNRRAIIWKSQGNGLSNGGDGGWNTTTFPVDSTKLYRFSVWMNRYVKGTDGSGYIGLNAFGTTDGCTRLQSVSWNTNPYFWSGGYTAYPENVWLLFVGHVYPAGTTHTSAVKHPDTGRWYVSGTKYGTLSYDYAWHVDTATARHRSYFYYADTNQDGMLYFYQPRVDLCDGTEPTLQDLLRNGRSYILGNILVN